MCKAFFYLSCDRRYLILKMGYEYFTHPVYPLLSAQDVSSVSMLILLSSLSNLPFCFLTASLISGLTVGYALSCPVCLTLSLYLLSLLLITWSVTVYYHSCSCSKNFSLHFFRFLSPPSPGLNPVGSHCCHQLPMGTTGIQVWNLKSQISIKLFLRF